MKAKQKNANIVNEVANYASSGAKIQTTACSDSQNKIPNLAFPLMLSAIKEAESHNTVAHWFS